MVAALIYETSNPWIPFPSLRSAPAKQLLCLGDDVVVHARSSLSAHGHNAEPRRMIVPNAEAGFLVHL